MSRHRNIRSMNYTDEYDGYDDVYGHSVEDDHCISPSDAAFMFDREGTRNQPTKIGAFLSSENDIAEEEEGESSAQESINSLSAADRAKLETCMSDMKITLGPAVTKERMIQVAQSHNFNAEKSINYLLDLQTQERSKPAKKEKESSTAPIKKFTIPKLNLAERQAKKKISNNTTLANNTCSILSNNSNLSGSVSNFNIEVKMLQNICKEDDKSINIPVKEVESLNLNLPKVVPSWNIDFTAAIKEDKITVPVRKVTVTKENTNFTPGFIDCDPLKNLEVGYFVDRAKLNSKKSYKFKRLSVFGKVLCTKFQRKQPYLINNNDPRLINRLEKFQFDTISPDDKITGHLRRK